MSHDTVSYQAGSLTYVLLGGVMFVDFADFQITSILVTDVGDQMFGDNCEMLVTDHVTNI